MEITEARAMVVGGSSGFGLATAARLTKAGGRVVILGRDGTKGEAAAQFIGATFFATDIADCATTEDVIRTAVDHLGGLDVAVNTAGTGIAVRTISRDGVPHDLDAFRSMIEVNLIATFNLNRLQAVHMSRNEPNEDGERGVIVNTVSIAAFEGQVGQVAYSAAKAGIAAMSLPMARDLGALGIRVNAIAPSLFDTDATSRMSAEVKAALLRDAPFPRRMGHPDEFARLAMAIVDNPMLNGGTIRLDAGERLPPR